MNGEKLEGALSECFSTGECNGCGACCTYFYGFDLPTHRTIVDLRLGVQELVIETFEKLPGPCPHLTTDSKCAIYDLRIARPELFPVCNSFKGDTIGVRLKKRRRVPTSSREELLSGLVDSILIPRPYGINTKEIILATQKYIQSGYFEGLTLSDYRKGINRLSEKTGSHLVYLYLKGYFALFSKFHQNKEIMDAILFILDFFHSEGIIQLIASKRKGINVKITERNIQLQLLFFSGGKEFFQKLAPWLFDDVRKLQE